MAHYQQHSDLIDFVLRTGVSFARLSVVAVLIFASDVHAVSDEGFDAVLRPFLETYCIRCHGETAQKGERRFDRFSGEVRGETDLIAFQEVLDQLDLHEMPPQDAPQPAVDERGRIVQWLKKQLAVSHGQFSREQQGTVLRRLNAREYENTVRDLLQLDMTMFHPSATFPRDQITGHLDNVGSELAMSGYLLQKYLSAAEDVIDRAALPLQQPSVQTWKFTDDFRQQPEVDQVHRRSNEFRFMTLYEVTGADKHEGAYGPIHAFASGVPCNGKYEIRLRAEAVNRQHPYDPDFYGTDPNEPLRLGIVPGDRTVGQLHKPQPVEPLLADIQLDDELRWYSVVVPLDAGYTPRFTYRNGPIDMRNMYAKVLRKYPEMFPELKSRGIVEARYTAIVHGRLPQIRIHEIEIRGPLYEEWPTASQRRIWSGDWDAFAADRLSESDIRAELSRFAGMAFRRPATAEEVDRLMRLVVSRYQSGRSLRDAYCDGLKAVLCSPEFLYIDTAAEQLTAEALASRLSYFLWSSMPDAELLQAAQDGSLTRTDVLQQHTERMLADPRSDSFVDGFLNSWLTLRDLGTSPPDRSTFVDYYHYDLGSAMREETRRFFRHLLDHDLSIGNFLDSDFTFVNRSLARHYGLELSDASENALTDESFHKVVLKNHQRGGLLGQASVQTVTANGIDTSPVVRGVWILENILGTPPSPPPADVEPLDPDIRGARSIREQLEKHRNVAACFECHRSIDPLGFALENFDAIGGWREKYPRSERIDSSGELPNGQKFQGFQDFRKVLLRQQALFRRALTTKLLSYATGREMTIGDRPEIDVINGQMAEGSDGLRNLVVQIVLSKPFRSP